MAIYKERGDENGIGFAAANLGNFFLKRSQDSLARAPIAGVPESFAACRAEALSLLQQSIQKHEATGNLVPLIESYRMLSEAYTAEGQYKEALAAYTQYKTLNDSAFAGDNNVRIANLETQRELQLKDKQIEIDRLAVAKKRNERGFFIVGIGLLLAVILVVFRNYRVQRMLNGALSVEKEKVERRTEALDVMNGELNTTLTELKETQQQLIVAEKLKENEIIRSRISQDIHDDISSELTRISWVSELAKKKVTGADYAAIPDLLERLSQSSRETVRKLGEIIWAANPRNDSLGSLLSYMCSHITKFFADTSFQYSIFVKRKLPVIARPRKFAYPLMSVVVSPSLAGNFAGPPVIRKT